MKPTLHFARFTLSSLTCSAAMMFQANAASITHIIIGGGSKPLEIMNTDNSPNDRADISVVDGVAGYQGVGGDPNANTGDPNPATDAPVSGLFGDGTVVDYRFFRGPVNEAVSLELQTYAQGSAGRISTVFAATAGQVTGSQSFLRVWNSTSPGPGFGGGSIITPLTSADHTTNTMAGLGFSAQLGDPNVATIDITNMISGSIWFLGGGFGGNEEIRLRMTGTGQSNIDVTNGNPFWPRDNRVHLHRFDFNNSDLLYDTIQFDFDHSDDDGSAARFGGVILEGVIFEAGNDVIPEPSAFALAALGGLCLLGRRR